MKTLDALNGSGWLKPPEDQVAYPWKPVQWWNLAARARRRARKRHHREQPCCAGYRYGTAWQAARTEALTIRGGHVRPELPLDPDERVAWVERRVSARGFAEQVVDFVAVIRGPFQPCPTCGQEPPLEMREAWIQHVREGREKARRMAPLGSDLARSMELARFRT